MFHVTWTTFKFNSNQLGTVSAYVMISVPWSNQRAHQVISEKLLSKKFYCRTKDHKLRLIHMYQTTEFGRSESGPFVIDDHFL